PSLMTALFSVVERTLADTPQLSCQREMISRLALCPKCLATAPSELAQCAFGFKLAFHSRSGASFGSPRPSRARHRAAAAAASLPAHNGDVISSAPPEFSFSNWILACDPRVTG